MELIKSKEENYSWDNFHFSQSEIIKVLDSCKHLSHIKNSTLKRIGNENHTITHTYCDLLTGVRYRLVPNKKSIVIDNCTDKYYLISYSQTEQILLLLKLLKMKSLEFELNSKDLEKEILSIVKSESN